MRAVAMLEWKRGRSRDPGGELHIIPLKLSPGVATAPPDSRFRFQNVSGIGEAVRLTSCMSTTRLCHQYSTAASIKPVHILQSSK